LPIAGAAVNHGATGEGKENSKENKKKTRNKPFG